MFYHIFQSCVRIFLRLKWHVTVNPLKLCSWTNVYIPNKKLGKAEYGQCNKRIGWIWQKEYCVTYKAAYDTNQMNMTSHDACISRCQKLSDCESQRSLCPPLPTGLSPPDIYEQWHHHKMFTIYSKRGSPLPKLLSPHIPHICHFFTQLQFEAKKL